MKRMKNSKALKLKKPRVRIHFNTGTKVILSKKDKARSRQSLKKFLSDEFF